MTDVVTLTLNPAIDMSASVDKVVPVRKLRCRNQRSDPGGGGINVARVVRRFGIEVLAVYPVGGFPGRLLLQLVEHEGVPSLPVEIAGETREDTHILDESTGEQFRFVFPGPHLAAVEWHRILAAATSLHPLPRYLVASGGLADGVPDDFYARLARRCRRDGVPLILDTHGPSLAPALKVGVHLVKPNQREFCEYLGRTLETPEDFARAAGELVADGRCEVAVVTLGESGAVLATREGGWISPALPAAVTSAVGAGDSFMGAMVAALFKGASVQDAFRTGVAGGTATLLRPGTELCHPEDVERLLPQVSLRRL